MNWLKLLPLRFFSTSYLRIHIPQSCVAPVLMNTHLFCGSLPSAHIHSAWGKTAFPLVLLQEPLTYGCVGSPFYLWLGNNGGLWWSYHLIAQQILQNWNLAIPVLTSSKAMFTLKILWTILLPWKDFTPGCWVPSLSVRSQSLLPTFFWGHSPLCAPSKFFLFMKKYKRHLFLSFTLL